MSDMTELERLRARVAELEAERAQTGAVKERSRRSRWWAPVSAVMLVLACLLAPVSVASVWAGAVISDTDRYVETVAPLIDDPAVREALANEVTTAVVENLGVQQLTAEALETIADQPNVPPRVADALPALAVPIADGVESFTRDEVEAVLASPRFAQIWAEVNRVAHEQVVTLLEGDQAGVVSAQGDTITLDLAPVIAAVKDRLVDGGFDLAGNIPVVDRSFVLAQSDAIAQAQGLYRLLDNLGVWLPFVTLMLFVGGVAMAKDRRRAVLKGALGLVAAMIALGAALALARTWYVGTTPANVLTAEAAGGVFDTVVGFLRTSLRALAVAGILAALAAFLAGPSGAAVKTRGTFQRGLGSAREGAQSAGWDTGRVGTWTFAHRRTLQLTSLTLGGLALMFWTRPTAWVVVGVALAVVLALAVIELLGAPPPPADAVETTATAAPAVPLQVPRASDEQSATSPQPEGTGV